MAFHANTEWDVRTTGNDANGGGFQVGSTGTDRSQSDAAYQAYTDIVIDHTTNTKITSAAHPFDATSVGNVINITAGTGFTVQRVQIVSEAAGVATCDKAVGTIDSTGGTGNLGGALLTPGAAAALVVSGNIVHVKAETYVVTSTVTISGVLQTWVGYQTSHWDYGTKPLITTATDSVNLITISGSADRALLNLSLSNTASVRGKGIYHDSVGNSFLCHECVLDGFAVGIDGDQSWDRATVSKCEVKNCTSHGVRNDNSLHVSECSIHDNVGWGIYNDATQFAAIGNRVTNNTLGGIVFGASLAVIKGNTIANNAGGGIKDSNGGDNYRFGVFQNNVIYNNGDWGISIDSNTLPLAWISSYNALGANTRGDYGKTGTSTVRTPTRIVGAVTLTADPFTNAAGDDYSLNNDAGGGAACRGAGYQPS